MIYEQFLRNTIRSLDIIKFNKFITELLKDIEFYMNFWQGQFLIKLSKLNVENLIYFNKLILEI